MNDPFPYSVPSAVPAAVADETSRATFVRRTYGHLALAILIFAGLEYLLLHSSFGLSIAGYLIESGGKASWLVVLGAFMLVSYIANKWAYSSTSRSTQYAGLGLYVVAEAFIFLPILTVATYMVRGNVIGPAAVMTLGLTLGLTAIVVITKKDFSFLSGILSIGFFVAMGLIVCSFIFGLNLGTWFSAIMVVFSGISILYTTSNVMRQYHTEQYVAASLSLFASIALMFWYILRIFMSSRD